MKTLAAVLVKTNAPLELWELEIPALRPGQVLVQMHYSGVCHTQLLEARGHRGEDRFLPHCLGHEGSGRVVDVGADVSKVNVGDDVITCWIKGHGADVPGSVYRCNNLSVNGGAITTLMQYAVISENRLVKVPMGLALDAAALMGCAVPTGAGMIFNSLQARAGQSIAIFGLGGVGNIALAAARAVGCEPIFAVDIDSARLVAAKSRFNCQIISSYDVDPAVQIKALLPQGVDLAVEATGRPDVMATALACVRPRGGTAVIAGNVHFGERLSLDPQQFNQGKRLIGCWGGDCEPDRDLPRFGAMISAKQLDVTQLLSARYEFEQVNKAFDDLESRRVLRPIIAFN